MCVLSLCSQLMLFDDLRAEITDEVMDRIFHTLVTVDRIREYMIEGQSEIVALACSHG